MGCPVCNAYAGTAAEAFQCSDCHLSENIWVCMACGRGGCGRYTYTHAKGHFHETGHPFSLELATGRIWDYVHDVFVHHDGYLFDCGGLLEGPVAASSWVCGVDIPKHEDTLDSVTGVRPGKPPSPSDRVIDGYTMSGGYGGTLDELTTQKISNVAGYYEVSIPLFSAVFDD